MSFFGFCTCTDYVAVILGAIFLLIWYLMSTPVQRPVTSILADPDYHRYSMAPVEQVPTYGLILFGGIPCAVILFVAQIWVRSWYDFHHSILGVLAVRVLLVAIVPSRFLAVTHLSRPPFRF